MTRNHADDGQAAGQNRADEPLHLSLGDLLLSHHTVRQLDHCYRVRIGRRALYLCARCCGLYPVLVVVLVVSVALKVDWRVGPTVMVLFCVPALVDWAAARLGWTAGLNSVRTATGALAGLGMGLHLPEHFGNPTNSAFWWSLGALCATALMVEVVARLMETPQDRRNKDKANPNF